MTAPKKIAVLGGGVGSLATVFSLTNEPDWQSRYDITVYQLGWRLGGKGASGRSGQVVHRDGVATIEGSARIEEHGLHIWLGFYDNAFRMIQQVYAENGKNLPPDAPLRSWTDAFKKHSYVCVQEKLEDGALWRNWPFCFPEDDQVPGTERDPCTVWDYLKLLLEGLLDFWKRSELSDEPVFAEEHAEVQSRLAGFAPHLGKLWHEIEGVGIACGTELVELACRFAHTLHPDATEHSAADHHALIGTLDALHAWLCNHVLAESGASRQDQSQDWKDQRRRVFIVMDIGIATVRGIIRDGALFSPNGLDVLEEEFQSWLSRHGASDLSCRVDKSAVIRGLYDLVFAYIDGDTNKASFAAGPALRSVFNMLLRYKGAIFWKMQAGMGDTIFGPIYMVLRARGVKFAFFHNVENIGLTPDRKGVATIRMGRQVTLRDTSREYDPIVWVKGVPCWPARPDYSQIVEADELRKQHANLESFWKPWKSVETITLEAGSDFDEVVLGISLGALPYLCKELIDAAPETWARMVRDVRTVRTMGFQFWVNRELPELGWNEKSPVLDAFVEPLNTWADMSQLLVRETWAAGHDPKSCAYFCGQLVEEVAPDQATAYVKQQAQKFVDGDLPNLWPGLQSSGGAAPGQYLVSPTECAGETPLASQYFRANVDPSERYVMSVAGATGARLRADESGFDGLVLTGDWIDNGFNAGCVEASVMSGLEAANVVAGRPIGEGIISLRPGFGKERELSTVPE